MGEKYADYGTKIDNTTETIKLFRRNANLFYDEDKILEVVETRYALYYAYIHKYLSQKKTSDGEREIRERIKELAKYDLPVCERKMQFFSDRFDKLKARKVKDENEIKSCKHYIEAWLSLYDNIYALIAFRSLEHFALYLEWDKPETGQFSKIWKYSIDPFNDKGWSGCTKGFWYYGNQMILDNKIKFLMKQMPTSFGKCVHPMTKVRTPNGIKTVFDLNVGDSVYSMENNALCVKKVTNKWYNTRKQVKLTTKGGQVIIVSPEHRMFTQRGYVQAKDLTINDYLYRLCTPIKQGIRQDDDELMFASLMMFDGSCRHYLLSFTQEENEIFYEFIKLCERLKFKYRISEKKNCKAKTIYVLYNEGRPDAILEKYGILNCLSKNKKMSPLILNLPLEQRYKFLGYMFATDGFIPRKTQNNGRLAGITLASKDLAIGIRDLLNSCGIYATLNYKKTKIKDKYFDSHVVQISEEYFHIIAENVYCYHKQGLVDERMEIINNYKILPECINTEYPKELVANCKEFKRIVRKQFARNIGFKRKLVEDFNEKTGLLSDIVYKDFVFEKIKSIEFEDTEIQMIDIEVEDTHNFIANDLVSHNSYSDSVMIAFIFGYDPSTQILKVVGNPELVGTCTNQIVDIMTHPTTRRRYLKVFPQFLDGLDEETQYLAMAEPKDTTKMTRDMLVKYNSIQDRIIRHIFSVCPKEKGKFTLAIGGRDVSFLCITKEKDRDGIPCTWLFLDDIVQRSEIMDITKHQKDTRAFDGTWKKRCRDERELRIVVGGTTYDPYDLLVTLKSRYSKGKVKKSPINKYTTLSLDETAVFVCVPKLDEKDQLTFPHKTVLENVLEDRKNDYELFMAMDMQQPLAPKDNPFYWDELRLYESIPEDRSGSCYAACDLSRTGFDNNSMPIFCQCGEDYYLIDAMYEQDSIEHAYLRIVEMVQKHHIVKLVIENNIETSIKSILEQKFADNGINYCEIIPLYSTQKKENRIYDMGGTIRNRIVFPSRYLYAPSSQVGKFMLDIVSYNKDGKNKHDDSIDSVAMFADNVINKSLKNTKARLIYC